MNLYICICSILGTVLVVLGLYAFLWGKGKELKLAATVAAQKEQQGGVILNTQKIQGYAELHNCGLAHLKSSALRCAVGLGIPNAIDRCGGVATISDIYHPNWAPRNQAHLPPSAHACAYRLWNLRSVVVIVGCW
jgi:hypothetical protein